MRLASGCFTERRAACAQRCELMHRLRAVRLLCTAASGPPRRLPPQRLPRSQQAGGEPQQLPPGLTAVRDSGPPRSVPTPRQSERVQDLAVANRKLSDFPAGVVSSPPPPSAAAAPAGRATAAAAVGSLRDALVEYKIALPGYSVGQHRIQCPLCRGGAVSARRSLHFACASALQTFRRSPPHYAGLRAQPGRRHRGWRQLRQVALPPRHLRVVGCVARLGRAPRVLTLAAQAGQGRSCQPSSGRKMQS